MQRGVVLPGRDSRASGMLGVGTVCQAWDLFRPDPTLYGIPGAAASKTYGTYQ
jgi:hypothetical protein